MNELRKEQPDIKIDFPYPPYKEYRIIDKFESVKELNQEITKIDDLKTQKGLFVMKKFIASTSLESLSDSLLSKTMDDYFKQIGKHDMEKWEPHPMIKALMMALWATREKENEGRNFAIAGDGTSPETSHFMFGVGVKLEHEKYNIETITELSDNNHEYFTSDIEKIMRTESILERYQGDAVPISTYIETLKSLGLNIETIKKSERKEAIEIAKQMIKDNKIRHVLSDNMTEISNMQGEEDWDKIDTTSRALIANCFGISKHKQTSKIVITTNEGLIEKWKCRVMILEIIKRNQFPIV